MHEKFSDKIVRWVREIAAFLSSPIFLINFGKMLLVVAVLGFVIFKGLELYTNHGQSVTMGYYVGKDVAEAAHLAESRNFDIIISDSIFIPGRRGGLIIEQTPKGGEKVKEGRSVYCLVTKFKPEAVTIGKLPELYGKNFALKKKELMQVFQLDSRIAGYEFDEGAADHILKVMYKGNIVISSDFTKSDVAIDKGETLDFILSKKDGAQVTIPDLICKKLRVARFITDNSNITIGEIIPDAGVGNEEEAYIYKQVPAFDPNVKINPGDQMIIYITTKNPSFCPPDEDSN
ncbi:MAG: PASTA domain-containing protein [Saprospiraceae bacterium]|nr:PASTA domain-containing protein [Saprospiraceae bacterium]